VNALRWPATFALLWLALLVALCSSCAPRPISLPDEARQAEDAAMAGWLAAGLPACPSLRSVGVRYAWAPCGNRNAAGCVQQGVIVLREGQPVLDDQGGPVVHEWMHLARYRCAGGRDEGHTDPRVWIEAGGEGSAQGRARAFLQRVRDGP
jgi:hypothetical protein